MTLADIVVLGAWKCGSTSLELYLIEKNPNKVVAKAEIFHLPDDRAELHNFKEDAEYYVILRKDTGQFALSFHRFFYPELSTYEFFKKDNLLKTGMDIFELANWKQHIERWSKRVKNLHVVYLEEMKDIEGFPHLRSHLA